MTKLFVLVTALLLFSLVHGNNYTFINACTGNVTLTRLKEVMASVFHEHIYTPNLSNYVDIYNDVQQILEPTSSLQTDLIIDGIDNVTLNATNCNWDDVFSMYFTPSAIRGNGVHFLFFFFDSQWCGVEPYRSVSMLRMHHVVVPISIGSHTNRMELYHIMGPCPKPRCYHWRDYLILDA